MRFELLLIFIASLVQAQSIAEGELIKAEHEGEEAVAPVELAYEDLPEELTVMVKAMQNPSEKKGGCTRKGCGNGCGCGPWKPPRHDDALEILRDAFPEYQVYIPRRRRHCRSSYSSRSSCSSSSSSYSSSSSCSVPTCWDNYLISCSSSSSSRDFCGPVPPKPCPKPPKPPHICSSSSSSRSSSSSSSSSCHRPRPPKPCPKPPRPCRPSSSRSSSSCHRPPKPCPKPPKPCPKPPKPCPKPPKPSSSSSCSFPRPRPCPRPPKPCSSSSSSSSSCHRPKPCPKPPKPTPCPKPPKPDCHRPCPIPSESSSGLCDLCPKFKAIEISRRLLAKMQYYLNNGRYADIWPLIHPSSSYYIQKLKACDNCIYEFGSLKNYFPTTIGTEIKSMLKGYHYFKDGSVALHTLDFVKQSGMCKETYEMYYYYSADHGCNYKLSYITGRNIKCKGCLKPQARCGK